MLGFMSEVYSRLKLLYMARSQGRILSALKVVCSKVVINCSWVARMAVSRLKGGKPGFRPVCWRFGKGTSTMLLRCCMAQAYGRGAIATSLSLPDRSSPTQHLLILS